MAAKYCGKDYKRKRILRGGLESIGLQKLEKLAKIRR